MTGHGTATYKPQGPGLKPPGSSGVGRGENGSGAMVVPAAAPASPARVAGEPVGTDMVFQCHFFAPPEPVRQALDGLSDADGVLPCNPVRHNPAKPNTEFPQIGLDTVQARMWCPDASWFQGQCVTHGCRHVMYLPCKRRDCDFCGPVSRRRIADRIAHGIHEIELAGGRCAWLVLTFKDKVAEFSAFKPMAVRQVQDFVRWLRKKRGMTDMWYVATYELTARGRLHVNLICGPWKHVRHRDLYRRWGSRISVEWVRNDVAMGREAAKAYSPEALGGYLAKLDQAVPQEWGPRVSFSKKWPKLPMGGLERVGEITWSLLSDGARLLLWDEIKAGRVLEYRLGEYFAAGELVRAPDCNCFDFKTSVDPPG